jgi:endo-1,4-beta-xylanase
MKMVMNIRLIVLVSIALVNVSTEACAQLAAGSCKFLGNIIASSTPVDFTKYWNQVSPENAGKWQSVEATRDVMNWSQLDNAYQTAIDNDLFFKQHTLVWGQQQPDWMNDLSTAEQKEEVEEWISEFCSRYPETNFIDVVNEPLHAVPSYMSALGGSGTTGWDWVVWSFEKTRQYCPNAKLFLNDYNILSNNSSTNTYLEIINVLKDKNLIDGIGEQGHFMESTPISTITTNLDKLSATGLPIQISEFDLNFSNDTDQKNRYVELFPKLWEHHGVHGMTLWGYKQGEIWQTNAYLIRSNGTSRPAFTWLKEFLAESGGGVLCLGMAAEEMEAEPEIYPNPLHGNKLKIEIAESGYTLKIIDQVGHVQGHYALKPGINEVVVDRSAGIYVLVLSNGVTTRLKKIAKY